MKRILATIAASAMLTCGALTAPAQTIIDTSAPSKVVNMGFRIGFNTSNLTTNFDEAYPQIVWNHTQWRPGFTMGAVVDINLRNCFAIQSGLYFKSRNSDFHYLINNMSLEAIEGHWGAYYLEIPILASFRLGVAELAQAQIDLGPYFATGFGGKVDYTVYSTVRDTYFEPYVEANSGKGDYFGDKGIARRGDWGLKFGLGFLVMQKFYIGAHYNFSCMNMMRDSKEATKRISGHNKAWTFTVGYNF